MGLLLAFLVVAMVIWGTGRLVGAVNRADRRIAARLTRR